MMVYSIQTKNKHGKIRPFLCRSFLEQVIPGRGATAKPSAGKTLRCQSGPGRDLEVRRLEGPGGQEAGGQDRTGKAQGQWD